MKKNNIYILLLAFLGLFGCTNNEELELISDDISTPPTGLSYTKTFVGISDTAAILAPSLEQAPETVGYTVQSKKFIYPNGTTVMNNNVDNLMLVTIDPLSGAFKVQAMADANGDKLLPFGQLSISVSANYRGGGIVYDSAANLFIDQLPISLSNELAWTIDFLEEGVIGQFEVSANEGAEFDAEILSYHLMEEVVGFDLNAATGEISKTDPKLADGDYVFNPYVTTSHGLKYFEDSVVVTITPLELDITYPQNTTIDFTKVGVVFTPTINVPGVTIEEFQFMDEYSGYTIDKNSGVITRNAFTVPEEDIKFDIAVVTDKGTYETAIVFNIEGELSYKLMKGTQEVSKVKVTPWSTFSGLVFTLESEDFNTFTKEYSLTNDIEGLSIDASTGEIKLEDIATIEEGTQVIEVEVSLTSPEGTVYSLFINNVFDLIVEKQWYTAEVDKFILEGGNVQLSQNKFNSFHTIYFDGYEPALAWHAPIVAKAHESEEGFMKLISGVSATNVNVGLMAFAKELNVNQTEGKVREFIVQYKDGQNFNVDDTKRSERVGFDIAGVDFNMTYNDSDWTTIHDEENEENPYTPFLPAGFKINNSNNGIDKSGLTTITSQFEVPASTETAVTYGMFIKFTAGSWNIFAKTDFEYSYAVVAETIFE